MIQAHGDGRRSCVADAGWPLLLGRGVFKHRIRGGCVVDVGNGCGVLGWTGFSIVHERGHALSRTHSGLLVLLVINGGQARAGDRVT